MVNQKFSKFSGRIVDSIRYDTPGAWDNWALPEHSYVAVVINHNGEVEEVRFGFEKPIVDANPNFLAIYEAYKIAKQIKQAEKRAAEEAAIPKIGRKVKVVKGRKVPIGTEGEVFWFGNTAYGQSVGIRLLNGQKVFTARNNVKVMEEK